MTEERQLACMTSACDSAAAVVTRCQCVKRRPGLSPWVRRRYHAGRRRGLRGGSVADWHCRRGCVRE